MLEPAFGAVLANAGGRRAQACFLSAATTYEETSCTTHMSCGKESECGLGAAALYLYMYVYIKIYYAYRILHRGSSLSNWGNSNDMHWQRDFDLTSDPFDGGAESNVDRPTYNDEDASHIKHQMRHITNVSEHIYQVVKSPPVYLR